MILALLRHQSFTKMASTCNEPLLGYQLIPPAANRY